MHIPRLTASHFITADGEKLAYSSWNASSAKAVIIALHGFNDYRHFFHSAGEFLQRQHITSYSYDQRGFGDSSYRGYWAGADTYSKDVIEFTRLIKQRHPTIPIYLLGESMGGAVVVNSNQFQPESLINGMILCAPAVWGRHTMPWYQTALLWALSYSVPWLTLTGEGLDIKPSDNIEMLLALGKDPLVIKETRVDAIYGITNLMDKAQMAAKTLSHPLLLLYGEKDDIVPKEPTLAFINHFPESKKHMQTLAFYPDGYHMLLRDLQAAVVWNDIAHWIFHAALPLPSGAETNLQDLINKPDLITVHTP